MSAKSEVSPQCCTGTVRPDFKRGRRYSAGAFTHDQRDSSILARLAIPPVGAWMKDLRQAAPDGTGYPGNVKPRFGYGESTQDCRTWNYHLIRKIHHRHSPIGYHLRPLSLKDQRRISRETAEELKRALNQIIEHENCNTDKCDHIFRMRAKTDPRKYKNKDSDNEVDFESKIYESIEAAVRVELDKKPELICGVSEAALSPPSPESTGIVLPKFHQRFTEPETPAWVITPALSWANSGSAEDSMLTSALASPVEQDHLASQLAYENMKPQIEIIPNRSRARTIEKPLEGVVSRRGSNRRFKTPKETDGIKALRLLQQRYAAEHRAWLMGGLDDPVQVWVDDWANGPGVFTVMDNEGSLGEFEKITAALEGVAAGIIDEGKERKKQRERSRSNVDFLTEESRKAADILLTD